MKRIITFLTLLFFAKNFSQNIPESKFLLGAEIGINTNQSDYENDSNKVSFQGGILAEYVINKNFSLMGKLKFYDSQIIFTQSRIIGSGMFGNKYQFITCEYNGTIISIPITVNYNFKIYKNLSGSIRFGTSINSEISSRYDYATEVSTDYSKYFIGISGGLNLNYNTGKTAYFIGFEPMFGAKRGMTSGKDFNNQTQTHNYSMENYLFNVGVKFKIK